MASVIRIRVRDTVTQATMEREFDRLPIRVGRNLLNDFQIDQPYVSQFHLVVEQRGNTILLRDLGSRNGTLVPNLGRVQPDSPVDLSTCNWEFQVHSIVFTVMSGSAEAAAPARKRARTMFSVGRSDYPAAVAQTDPRTEYIVQALSPWHQRHRQTWEDLRQQVGASLHHVDEGARKGLLETLAIRFPELTHEAQFVELVTQFGGHLPEASGERATERHALAALRELCTMMVGPTGDLSSREDTAAFLQRVHETLEVFLKCFIPLRAGMQEFEQQLQLTMSGSSKTTGASNSVEKSRTIEQLRKSVLDWKDGDPDAAREVEGAFADVMIHQMCMVSGVMNGVKALLGELSPPSLEKTLDADKTGKYGSTFGPYRYKALWTLLKVRHADLTDGEKEMFTIVFGRHFANTFAKFAQDAAVTTGGRATSLPTNPSQMPPAAPAPQARPASPPTSSASQQMAAHNPHSATGNQPAWGQPPHSTTGSRPIAPAASPPQAAQQQARPQQNNFEETVVLSDGAVDAYLNDPRYNKK